MDYIFYKREFDFLSPSKTFKNMDSLDGVIC
jgi:hypothetical protein